MNFRSIINKIAVLSEDTIKEVELLPYIKKTNKFKADGSLTGNDFKPDSSWKKIGNLGRFNIFYKGWAEMYVVVNSETNKIDICFTVDKYDNHVKVDGVSSTSKGPKVSELYYYLLKHKKIKTLVTTSQSPGGRNIWVELAKKPGISIYGFDNNTKKFKNIDIFDQSETHALDHDTYASYGNSDDEKALDADKKELRQIKDMWLVATYFPKKMPKYVN